MMRDFIILIAILICLLGSFVMLVVSTMTVGVSL